MKFLVLDIFLLTSVIPSPAALVVAVNKTRIVKIAIYYKLYNIRVILPSSNTNIDSKLHLTSQSMRASYRILNQTKGVTGLNKISNKLANTAY